MYQLYEFQTHRCEIDDKDNVKLKKGEKYTYLPYQLHSPYSTVDSTYKVVFR